MYFSFTRYVSKVNIYLFHPETTMRKLIHVGSVALLAGLMTATACNKIDVGPDNGISYRDDSNASTGDIDLTDWASDKKWNKKEQELFKAQAEAFDLNGAQQTSSVNHLGAYPNPVQLGSTVNFFFGVPVSIAGSQLRLVIVDRKYKVVEKIDVPVNVPYRDSLLPIKLSGDKYKPDNFYRIYYLYSTTDNTLLYKGHGDILVK
jgi:hypothetical protein